MMDSQRITPAALSRAMIRAAPPATEADFSERIKGLSLSELNLERAQMHRLGLTNLVHELDEAIEVRRKERRKAREDAELALLASRRAEVTEKRDADLAALRAAAREKRDRAEAEVVREHEELEARTAAQYEALLRDTAARATGGVSVRDAADDGPPRATASARSRTRRPRFEVLRMRENATRLRAAGRDSEAHEFEMRAARLDETDETKWRDDVIAASCRGAGSVLMQHIVQMEKEVDALRATHEDRLRRIDADLERDERLLLQAHTHTLAKAVKHAKAEIRAEWDAPSKAGAATVATLSAVAAFRRGSRAARASRDGDDATTPAAPSTEARKPESTGELPPPAHAAPALLVSVPPAARVAAAVAAPSGAPARRPAPRREPKLRIALPTSGDIPQHEPPAADDTDSIGGLLAQVLLLEPAQQFELYQQLGVHLMRPPAPTTTPRAARQ